MGRILWILGAVVLGVAVFSARQQIAVLSSWSKTEATVKSCEIVRYFAAKSKPVYRVRLTVEYQLEGVPHFVISSSSMGSSDVASVNRKAARFPNGSHRTIYYDPNNPNEMRFDAGYTVDYLAIPLIIGVAGIVFVVAGTVFRVIASRRASALG